MDRFVKTFPFVVLMWGLVLSAPHLTSAQTIAGSIPRSAQAQPSDQQSQAQDQQESRKEQKHNKKEKQKNDNELKKELDSQYKKWLDEDVIYIITPEERHTFLHLPTNEEREQFIEAFWQRRNPDPDSPENTFKEEHYRRIAYANEHYASGIPGWKTDRGRIYIMWGLRMKSSYTATGRHVRTALSIRAAGRPRRTRLRTGAIGISRAWAKTLSSSSSIRPAPANII